MATGIRSACLAHLVVSASGGRRQPLNASGQDERGARTTSADRFTGRNPPPDIELEALLGRMSAPIRSGARFPTRPGRVSCKCVPYLPVSDYVAWYG